VIEQVATPVLSIPLPALSFEHHRAERIGREPAYLPVREAQKRCLDLDFEGEPVRRDTVHFLLRLDG
jgi:hypothetical protein